MSRRSSAIGVLFVCFIFLYGYTSYAQTATPIQHQAPTVVNRAEPVQLTFDAPGINPGEVRDAFIYYKFDGEVSYQQIRAEFDQGMYSVQFSIDNENAGMLEYYLSIEMNNGERITYPADNPQQAPVQVDIVEREETVTETTDEVGGIEYTILSPEPGSGLPQNDVLIAITLFYEEGAVDTTTSSFRLLLDGNDITDQARASDFFFSYAPEEIANGEHQAVLQLTKPDETVEIVSWDFTVLSPSDVFASESFGEPQTESFVPQGQVELTARNQEVGGFNNDVLRGNFRLSGSKGEIRYSAYGLLTSQESSRLQPQNRYGAELYVGDWFELQGGHIYPTLSRLSIAGRRVQGINTALHVLNGGINFQFLFGQLNRDISNLYSSITPNITQSGGVPIDTTYTLGFQNNGIGTFQRDVLGARMGIGKGRNFQWGLNFLKVRDDTNSISTITNYNDLIAENPELDDNLSQAEINDLQSNPSLLNVNGNPLPKDNVVVGTDLKFNLFKNSLQFRTEGAVSLLNEDISGGVLTNDNGLGIDVDQDVSDQLDKLSWLIIINENMSTLPLRFNVEGNQTEVEGFFPTGIIASQSELNFNIAENNLRLQYRWIGPDFVSLANSTIRRDIAGISATDRFNLFQKRLYVTLGYESLSDNVIDTRDATTTTNTFRTNLSWFPIEQFLPRVSFGYMYRNRDNEVPLLNPFVNDPLQDIAVRNFEIANGDTLVAPNPTLSNTNRVSMSVSQQFNLFDISHDASLNFSVSGTKDDFFRYGDTDNSSVSFTIRSQLSRMLPFPLNTRIGFNINNTETLSGLSDISIFGFTIGGTTFLIDDKLNLNADLSITTNTTETARLEVDPQDPADPGDDIFVPQTDNTGANIVDRTENNLFIFRAGAQYNLNNNNAIMVNINFTNVTNQLGINPPNDHVLQARYIFRF